MKSILLALSVFFGALAQAQVLQGQLTTISKFDNRPVSVKEWNAFMTFLKSDPYFSKSDIVSMTPDQWNSEKITAENQDSPVTGVSWKQANAYCEWRGEMATYLNTHVKVTSYRQMLDDNKLAKVVVTYRLPTGEEYIKMAKKAGKGTAGFHCVYTSTTRSLYAATW